MPYYEYRCPDCGEIFEILQKIGADSHDVYCPACGAQKCEKLISVSVFQGGGACKNRVAGGCTPQGGFS